MNPFAAEGLLKRFWTVLASIRSRRWCQRWEKKIKLCELSRKIWNHTDGRVLSGPFWGLRFPESNLVKNIAPKLLGTYEFELHPFLRLLLSRSYKTFINIGSAEGYYAIGWAWCCQDTRVVAVEPDPWAKNRLRELAHENGVKEVETVSLLSLPMLRSLAGSETFVFCDGEGVEKELLDPGEVPELVHTTFLVEVHSHHYENMSNLLRSRFQQSHKLVTRSYLPEGRSAGLCVPWLTPDELHLAVDELRSDGFEWILGIPRSGEKELVTLMGLC